MNLPATPSPASDATPACGHALAAADPQSPPLPRPGDLLVVDDRPDNLRLLANLLGQRGHAVRKALNGSMARTAIAARRPDLILLDVNLPDVCGYDLCRELKANPDPAVADVPVIFVSVLDALGDRVTAFECGAVDYLVKPVQEAEAIARVETHLKLRLLQQELEAKNAQLRDKILESEIAEAKYRSIFENAIEGIYQRDRQGRYLSANPALAHLLGYDSPADLLADPRHPGNRYLQPKRWQELTAYLDQFGELTDFESEVYRRDGTPIWISENIRAVRNLEGALLRYEGSVQDVTERRQTERELWEQRRRSELLLLNILPHKIAQRLKASAGTIAESFDDVTVLFADIVDFTGLAARMPPAELVGQLNEIFSAFDRIVERSNLEKIKTIGDAYMAVAGLPAPQPDHAVAAAEAALAMQAAIAQFRRDDGTPFQLRAGLHSGPVVAGVIGLRKFIYDVWGDTVNVAARMEATGLADRVQVSLATYERLRDRFACEPRESFEVKGLGPMMTYWLIRAKTELPPR